MEKLLIGMVGLPRSGKSTWAKAYAKESGAPIVCPDTIRLALHGQPYVQEAEGFVWAIAKTMVQALFLAGHDTVLLDSTSVTMARRFAWNSANWVTRWKVIDTPKDVCLGRASPDLVPVIERMAADFQPLSPAELVCNFVLW